MAGWGSGGLAGLFEALLNLGPMTLGWGCPVHCRCSVTSLPGLNPLDASSTPPTPNVTAKNAPRCCQEPLGGKIALIMNH